MQISLYQDMDAVGVMMTYIVIWVACFMIACDSCSAVVMGIGHDIDRVPS